MSAPRARELTSRQHRMLHWLRVHAVVFVVAIVVLNALNITQGAPWWALWPTLVWAVVFAPHFFIVKALTIDEDWVDERAMEVREHSYDFDHMRDIEKRIVEDDFSVVPRNERDEDDR